MTNCSVPRLTSRPQWLWMWKRVALSCVLTLILLAIVVPTTVHFTHHPDVPPAPPGPTPTISVPSEIPDSSTEGLSDNNGTETSGRFVERDEWGARPPSKPIRKMKLPVPYVIISHTATDFCTTQSKCANELRIMQDYQMKNDYVDIAYNFLVGGDGFAYVGRSWDYVGAHSFSFNSKSIGISFIGTFDSVVPSEPQLRAAQKIIELGVKIGKIAPDYKLLGHRQVSKTLSPGDALYNEIKNWPHWSPQP